MVTSPNGKGVILIGGYNDSQAKTSKTLIELIGNSIKSLEWIILEQKLKYLRSYHIAFSIPDDLSVPQREKIYHYGKTLAI